ncbi:MAG TPA: class III lanthionine synthetase LanKC, partial [Trebonia sp.]|nr:class III lanthionine synthetase LanKC [Trebonia sp.]
MDKRYEAYCLADPLFYDHPAAREDLAPAFAHTRRPAPDGWSAGSTGDWWRLLPDRHRLPDQGWKIHVSATPGNAAAVLDALYAHCVPAGLPFKHLRSGAMLFLRNSKYAERGSSGKFATLYPADEAELEASLKQLDEVLAGQPGPYILSDLRYGAGPLYVRYGGFAPRRCLDAAGETVPAIVDPDGTLVPDRRAPVFAPPAWVQLPGFLAPHLAARAAATVADLPYRIERALHFSNGGGVYQGRDTRTGATVVLKEARPHAGLLGDGRDALARLESERDALRLAAGSGAGPEVLDWVQAGEHRFLVLEHIEGRTLNTLFSERYPLIGRDRRPEVLRDYTAWALGIAEKVEAAIDALHGRGVVFNDLHLFNIMVRPDDTLTLIDFEVAAPIGECGRQLLAARAFQAPRELAGVEVDRYALACLRLALFLPLTALLPLDRSRAAALADAVRGEFPDVPDAFLDEALATIGAAEQAGPAGQGGRDGQGSRDGQGGRARGAGQRGRIPPVPGDAPRTAPPAVDAPLARADWAALRASVTEAIALAASPERADRLFPGDIRQFAHPGAGLGIAHGAAGVLYALHATGASIPDEYEHWLLRGADAPPADARLGFYDGVHGLAYVLDLLGHHEPAHRLIALALDERWQRLGPDLAEGLSGVGLNLLHFAERTGDAALRGAALEAGRLAVELLAQQDAARPGGAEAPAGAAGEPFGHAGLMRGASGAALFFVRLYEHTGHDDWLARARAALRLDLARCTASERDGSLRVSEGWRALPYLA